MKDTNTPRMGVIYNGEKPLNFYLDDYNVTFMNTDFSQTKLEGPFVFGQTYNHQEIAIYKGQEPMTFRGVQRICTAAYIIATYNCLETQWDTFDSIEFVGGTLNALFSCSALKQEWQEQRIYFDIQKDERQYSFTIDDCSCNIIIYSSFRETVGFGGNSISNNQVHFQLEFGSPQPLLSLFEYIQKVKDILAFMCFRQNVGFDEINLHRNENYFSAMRVYLKENYENTEKVQIKNITFHDLKEKVGNLASIIFNSQERTPSYELSFIPKTDKDALWMSDDRIRLICSALECELAHITDLNEAENGNLKGLIRLVKKVVKYHERTANRLSRKTYDVVYSSISHWSMSASDRICALYHRYEREMASIAERTHCSQATLIDDKEIAEFVKYRNNITHGSFRVINHEIATTAFWLQGLVYCSILTRIGMSSDEINTLCREWKILS